MATYIPWILHEPAEGDFRLGDRPYQDLEEPVPDAPPLMAKDYRDFMGVYAKGSYDNLAVFVVDARIR